MNRGISEARSIIKDLYITKPNEYTLDEIISANKGPLIEYKKIDGAEGKIVNGELFSIITVNETKNIGRKRFSLAHEFGHFQMHKGIKTFFCDEDKFWDWGGKEIVETEANYFAAELLMPEEIFFKISRKEAYSKNYLEYISSEFNTSFLATAIRYAEVGNDPVLLICSKDSVIKWYKRNDEFKFFAKFKVHEDLPNLSLSYELLNKKSKDIISEVDPAIWGIYLKEDIRLYEECINFDYFGYALTFLFFR